jgi:hypothetical protein
MKSLSKSRIGKRTKNFPFPSPREPGEAVKGEEGKVFLPFS